MILSPNILDFRYFSGIMLRKKKERILEMNTDEKAVLKKAQLVSHWSSQKLYYCTGKKHQRAWAVKRGEVYFVDLGENVGSEENKIRPVVVLQSNSYNFKSPVFTCAIISTSPMSIPDIQIPLVRTYPYVDNKGIQRTLFGTIDLGQIKTVGKERIISKKICSLSVSEMNEVDLKIFNSLGLNFIISAKNNTIESLMGKIEYLKNQLNNEQKS